MLKSMTGYGRSQQILDGRDILVEIKSVNHRYFEFNARVPRGYGYLEERIKTLIGKAVSRGKIDVGVTVCSAVGKDAQICVNMELARGYVSALREIKDELMLLDNLSLEAISRVPDIFVVSKIADDEETICREVCTVAMLALESFINMREVEGNRMYTDICTRLDSVEGCVAEVERLSPKSIADYKTRLEAKLVEVLKDAKYEDQRILTEVALFAEKIAVDEETVRLKSHLAQFKTLLMAQESVGRKLDFLVQEINREINTIGSKCQDLEVTGIVVEMKSEIEKIREQIQNIE